MERKKIRQMKLLAGEIGPPHFVNGPPVSGYSKRESYTIEGDLKETLETYKPVDFPKHSYLKRTRIYFEGRIALLRLFIETGWDKDECLKFWNSCRRERLKQKSSYRIPYSGKPRRKDNFNSYGEPTYLCGTRRYPRKCRKTAWKRFYKLFPELKDKK